MSEVTQDSARAAGAASDAEAALVDIGERVKKATGSDPETVRAIAEASERARALVTSLSALSGKVPRTLLVGALGPVLAPLARLLERRGAGGGRERRADEMTSTSSDPELLRLLLLELERHLVTLEAEPRDVARGAARRARAQGKRGARRASASWPRRSSDCTGA